jgi:hypothetical protein
MFRRARTGRCHSRFRGARHSPEIHMYVFMKSSLLIVLSLIIGGCFIWPLKVAEELKVEVIDATSGNPIPHADVVYLACDVHDFDCSHALLVRTKANDKGEVDIESTRQWGTWIPAPGGIPAPNHLIAIWAPGYSAFVSSQYGDSINSRVAQTKRDDIIQALQEIPSDQTVNDELLNPRRELIGGKIKLVKR